MKNIFIAALAALILITACKEQTKAGIGINRKGLDPFLTCFYNYMDTARYMQTMLGYESALVKSGLLKSLSQKDYEAFFRTYVAPQAEQEKRRCPEQAVNFFKGFMATDCYASMSRENKDEQRKTESEELALLLYFADGGAMGGYEELVETLIRENRFSNREKRLFYLILFMPL